jgi:tripartite-type tricarboxylate transporter receptor subunit TctC
MMKIPRRNFLHLAAGAAALPVVSRFAMAQTYPERPITMIVPFAAGGTMDVIGRLSGRTDAKTPWAAHCPENITGADGTIGTGRLVRGRADGYTIMIDHGDRQQFSLLIKALVISAERQVPVR